MLSRLTLSLIALLLSVTPLRAFCEERASIAHRIVRFVTAESAGPVKPLSNAPVSLADDDGQEVSGRENITKLGLNLYRAIDSANRDFLQFRAGVSSLSRKGSAGFQLILRW